MLFYSFHPENVPAALNCFFSPGKTNVLHQTQLMPLLCLMSAASASMTGPAAAAVMSASAPASRTTASGAAVLYSPGNDAFSDKCIRFVIQNRFPSCHIGIYRHCIFCLFLHGTTECINQCNDSRQNNYSPPGKRKLQRSIH